LARPRKILAGPRNRPHLVSLSIAAAFRLLRGARDRVVRHNITER
jgi:hypothetical protein